MNIAIWKFRFFCYDIRRHFHFINRLCYYFEHPSFYFMSQGEKEKFLLNEMNRLEKLMGFQVDKIQSMVEKEIIKLAEHEQI